MEPAEPGVAAYIGRWRPSSVSPRAAVFAREVIAKAGPEGRERAKSLLWAAGKLADYGLGLGLEPVPEVLLHPSVTERFTRCAPGLSGAARRTLRTNLRFIGRRVVPQFYPGDRGCSIFCVSGDRRSQCDGCCAGGKDTLSEHGRGRKGAGNRR